MSAARSMWGFEVECEMARDRTTPIRCETALTKVRSVYSSEGPREAWYYLLGTGLWHRDPVGVREAFAITEWDNMVAFAPNGVEVRDAW